MEDNIGSFFNGKFLEKFWKLANMNILYKVDPDSDPGFQKKRTTDL